MLNNLEATILDIIGKTSAEMAQQIARATRESIADAILKTGGAAPAAPAKRGPGRPRKNAAPVAPAPAKPVKAAKPAKAKAAQKKATPKAAQKAAEPVAAKAPKGKRLERRTSKEVDRDDAKILAYVAAHPGARSVEIQKEVKMPKQNIASGLNRLREAGKVDMKGLRNGATYTAK